MTNNINITITLYEDKSNIHWEELETIHTFAMVGYESTKEFAEWLAEVMTELANNNGVDMVSYDLENNLGRLEAFGVDATQQMFIELNNYGIMFEIAKTARN